MSIGHGAQEHLRAIRQLMERATVYRTISAPTAFVGGLLSIGMAMFITAGAREFQASEFFVLWMLVLLLTAMANTWFILRGARQRGEQPISAGMKHALRSVAPALRQAQQSVRV